MKKTAPPPAKLLVLVTMILIMVTGCKKNDDSETVTDIDGNVYKTVVIGTQTWMAKNLKTTKFNDGTAIPLVAGNTDWNNLITPGYCWYDNNASVNGNTYGALYNFAAVTTAKLCPAGWHVPSQAEWELLRDNTGGENKAGGNLKEKGTTHWNSPNTGATDAYGFTALPGGERYQDSDYAYLGINNNFWSTTIGPGTNPFGIRMYNDSEIFHISEFHKGRGLSVRCVKN